MATGHQGTQEQPYTKWYQYLAALVVIGLNSANACAGMYYNIFNTWAILGWSGATPVEIIAIASQFFLYSFIFALPLWKNMTVTTRGTHGDKMYEIAKRVQERLGLDENGIHIDHLYEEEICTNGFQTTKKHVQFDRVQESQNKAAWALFLAEAQVYISGLEDGHDEAVLFLERLLGKDFSGQPISINDLDRLELNKFNIPENTKSVTKRNASTAEKMSDKVLNFFSYDLKVNENEQPGFSNLLKAKKARSLKRLEKQKEDRDNRPITHAFMFVIKWACVLTLAFTSVLGGLQVAEHLLHVSGTIPAIACFLVGAAVAVKFIDAYLPKSLLSLSRYWLPAEQQHGQHQKTPNRLRVMVAGLISIAFGFASNFISFYAVNRFLPELIHRAFFAEALMPAWASTATVGLCWLLNVSTFIAFTLVWYKQVSHTLNGNKYVSLDQDNGLKRRDEGPFPKRDYLKWSTRTLFQGLAVVFSMSSPFVGAVYLNLGWDLAIAMAAVTLLGNFLYLMPQFFLSPTRNEVSPIDYMVIRVHQGVIAHGENENYVLVQSRSGPILKISPDVFLDGSLTFVPAPALKSN